MGRYKANRKPSVKRCGKCHKRCGNNLAECPRCCHVFRPPTSPKHEPSPEEIAEKTAEIRQGWSPDDFRRHAVGDSVAGEEYTIPENVRTSI